MKVNIEGIDKAALLVALYHRSFQQGLGKLQPNIPMHIELARELLERSTYFDYLFGRVMKVDLKGPEMDTRLYDRDVGPGAGAEVVKSLRCERGV